MFLFYYLITVHTNWQEFFFLACDCSVSSNCSLQFKDLRIFHQNLSDQDCPFVSTCLATYTTGEKIYVKQNCKMSGSQNTAALVCCIVSCYVQHYAKL